MEQSKLRTRDEVEQKYKWAIEDLYCDDIKWQEDYNKLQGMMQGFTEFEGKLSESADRLLEYLQFSDEVNKILEKVYVYANQKLHEDLGNTFYQGLTAKASDLSVNISSLTAFAEPEILSMAEDKIRDFLQSNNGISVYEKYLLDLLRQKKHVLDSKTEKLLAKTHNISAASSDIFSMFNNVDVTFPELEDEDGNILELTHGRYVKFLESTNVKVRKSAFEAMYHEYNKFKNTLAAAFYANVKQANFYAEVRGYSSSRAAALDGGNIPEQVYDNLIETVNNRIELMHRYVSLRKKALGIEELHMYDLYTPMVNDVKIKVSFEKAKEMVIEGLKPMGASYLSVLQEGFDNGWIDVYENQGKRSGAYSWGANGTHPFVLLNYQDNLNNVFTLAHEMGHALHSYYSDAAQPYVYAGYRIFVAEVASTCNESLLIHHMIDKAQDKKGKAYLINTFLEHFKGTLYRQTMFAEFEKEVHQLAAAGEALTPDNLCEIYYKLNVKYYGDDMIIDRDIEMEWSRIPHFYTPFYVYQYATGFSAAIALSKRIMEYGEPAVDDYMKFLSGGNSKDPIDMLKVAGVDMSSPEPIEEALNVFKELLDEMEALLELN